MARGGAGPGGNAAAGAPTAGVGTPKPEMDHTCVLQLLALLVGQMVVLTLQSGERYAGVLSSATGDENLSVVLSAVQQLHIRDSLVDAGELLPKLVVRGADVREIDASCVRLDVPEEADARVRARGGAFRTDTEISNARTDGERVLQRWDESEAVPAPSGGLEGAADTLSGSTAGWDQFAANEARFGIKSDYDEAMYTTALDRSGRDFKEREKHAERLANEILEQGGTGAHNAHVAEERGLADDSGLNEEDRYGAVARGPNAYVPPSARAAAPAKGGDARADAARASEVRANDAAHKEQAPGVHVTAPDAATGASSGKELTADFRQFVSAERKRLVVRKAELAQKEKQNRLADLKAWAQSFQLKTPVPQDLPDLRRVNSAGAEAKAPAAQPRPAANAAAASPRMPTREARPGASATKPSSKLAGMQIPAIPPYNPERARARQAEAQASKREGTTRAGEGGTPTGSRLNARASAFNPQAASFTPRGSPAVPAAAPAAASGPSPAAAAPAAAPPAPPAPQTSPRFVNAFFGTHEPRNRPSTSAVRVRDDFKPWRNRRVPEANTVTPWWPFTGRPYRQHFPLPIGMPGMAPMPFAGTAPPESPMLSTPTLYPPAAYPGGPSPDGPPAGVVRPPPSPHAANSPGPRMGMVVPPYGQYAFPQAPYMGGQGAPPMAYGPQMMGQMPFSPGAPPPPPPPGAMYPMGAPNQFFGPQPRGGGPKRPGTGRPPPNRERPNNQGAGGANAGGSSNAGGGAGSPGKGQSPGGGEAAQSRG